MVSIIKDKDNRNIAIIERENDYVVAAHYNTDSGRWAQGYYDFKTLEEAEKYREKYYGENAEIRERWLDIKVSKDAMIKRYDRSTMFRMPTTNKRYSDYTYFIYNNHISNSTRLTDLQSDSREPCYEFYLSEAETVILRNRDGDREELTAQEFKELVHGTSDKDYERVKAERVQISLPQAAIISTGEKSTHFAMPENGEYTGYGYYLPNSVIDEDKNSEDGTLNASVGENFKITLYKGEEKKELTAKELAGLVSGTKTSDYKPISRALSDYRDRQDSEGKADDEDRRVWSTLKVDEKAVIATYDSKVLFKMPKGKYEGCVYYMPSGMVQNDDDGISIHISDNFEVRLKGGENGEQINLTASEFIAEVCGKGADDYEGLYRKPSEEMIKRFNAVESNLRENVPEEMRNKPNWVVVRTRENSGTGRLDKFLIDVHTDKFAESDNPETWTDFDTACKYARENGGVALAYALDGEDKICCIDLDNCIDEDGNYSALASEILGKCGGTYTEKSVSGKGLHVFGKLDKLDLKSFSKDGDMEFYQGGHFIAMTGDGAPDKLLWFDTPIMKEVLERKLEKRTEWKGTGEGVEGLSSIDDREVLQRAFASRNGDRIKRLYNGEDLQNNHSNSDMSLMNYLAFRCNHDIDQMLRINATSGLYRPDKPQSYYEHTAIKAVKSTPVYVPPKASTAVLKNDSGGNSKA